MIKGASLLKNVFFDLFDIKLEFKLKKKRFFLISATFALFLVFFL